MTDSKALAAAIWFGAIWFAAIGFGAIGFGAVSLAADGAARAANPAVNLANSNARLAGDCHGRDASLAGSDNIATIRGACRSFQIAGGGNRVLIDMAAGGTIKVYGSNNEVSWTSPGDVAVTAVGQDNTITRAR